MPRSLMHLASQSRRCTVRLRMGGETVADSNSDSDTQSQPEYMLTTYDNPYDPFTQWDEWYSWDERAGYCSCGLLERISKSSDELSDADQASAIQNAIAEIVTE